MKTALRLLLERLYMLQEQQHTQHVAWQLQRQKGADGPVFDFVVRILVPSSSCGMIIGKSGSNIKHMEETTGVTSVRLSPKESGDMGYPIASIVAATSERVVTITGSDAESCLQCLYIIVSGMTTHPDVSRYSNMTTSYSRVMPEQVVYPPVHQPPLRPVLVSMPPSPRQQHSSPDQHLWDSFAAAPLYQQAAPRMPTRRVYSSPDLPGISLSHTDHGPSTPDRISSYVGPMDQHGYSPLHMPGAATQAHHGMYLLPNPEAPQPELSTGHMMHSSSAPDLLAAQLEQSLHIAPTAEPTEYQAFAQQTPMMVGPNTFQAQVLVPDSMVGSILGRAGQTLAELMALSGTKIRLSQRGEYMPGTRSRIVSIRGPTAQSVWDAQFLMSQRVVLPPTATSYPAGRVSGVSLDTTEPSSDRNATE